MSQRQLRVRIGPEAQAILDRTTKRLNMSEAQAIEAAIRVFSEVLDRGTAAAGRQPGPEPAPGQPGAAVPEPASPRASRWDLQPATICADLAMTQGKLSRMKAADRRAWVIAAGGPDAQLEPEAADAWVAEHVKR